MYVPGGFLLFSFFLPIRNLLLKRTVSSFLFLSGNLLDQIQEEHLDSNIRLKLSCFHRIICV